MRNINPLVLLSLSAFALMGAECPGTGDDTGDTATTDTTTTGTTTDDTATTDTTDTTDPTDDTGGTGTITPGGFNATIQGTVQVLLYTLDDDGEYTYISWGDAYNDVFIFGDIFVGAFSANEKEGTETYYDEYVVVSPSTAGDNYELEVSTPETDRVRVMAANDYWGDRIIGTNDPIGNYPDEIIDPDLDDPNNTIVGVDVSILIPYWDGSSSGCGGGGDTSTLAGDIIITTSYAGGDATAMLLNTANEGPYHSTWMTPAPDGGGASGPYSLTTCSSYGDMHLIGAWDSNYNGLVDPAGDMWGVYISDTDIDGNPINVGNSATDLDIQIPFGDFEGLDLTPFVRLYGEVSTTETLAEGTQVYAAALKYRPNIDTYTSDLAEGYDYAVFDADAVAAGGPWAYNFVVPANTIAYLWAYADTDNDGWVNEEGEPVRGAGDDENGRVPTGSESQEYNLDLVIPD